MNIFIAVFLFVLGGTAFYVGIKMILLKSKYNAWHTTHGKVIEKRVDRKQLTNGSSRANYRLYVTYAYSVNGETFENNVYNAIELVKGEVATLEKSAIEEMNDLKSNPIVYYNPKNHNEAFLKNISSSFSWFGAILGLLLILTSLAMIFI